MHNLPGKVRRLLALWELRMAPTVWDTDTQCHRFIEHSLRQALLAQPRIFLMRKPLVALLRRVWWY